MPPLETLNQLFGIGTLVMQVVAIGLIAVLMLQKKMPDLSEILVPFEKYGLWLAFLLTLGASITTLVYSEIYGLAPCGWCWVQRVFLYPQVVLFAMAAWGRDRAIAGYAIALSIAGAAVALYQHYLQMGGAEAVPCPASGPGLDCAERFMFEFGYITFPLASASLFVFLIVLMVIVRRAPRTDILG